MSLKSSSNQYPGLNPPISQFLSRVKGKVIPQTNPRAQKRDHPPVTYLSLPAELRYQIMEDVLRGAIVKIPQPTRRWSDQTSLIDLLNEALLFLVQWFIRWWIGSPDTLEDVAKKQQITFHSAPTKPKEPQMIFTCKQTYIDGQHIFFSSSIFHLPPGSINNTIAWLSTVPMEFQKRIKSIVVNLALEDIPFTALEDIYDEAQESRYHDSLPDLHYQQTFESKVSTALEKVWSEKLRFLWRWGRGTTIIDSVHYTNYYITTDRPRPETPEAMEAILVRANMNALPRLVAKTREIGWEGAAAWLAKRGKGTEAGLEVTFVKG